MLPSATCTSYTLSGRGAGPLITAPVLTSNSEPWHWHMIVVPVSNPPGKRAGVVSAGAEVVERVETIAGTRNGDT
jgi:hypothetical protein